MEKTSVSASERCLAEVLSTIRLVVLVTVNHFTVAPTGLLTPVALGFFKRPFKGFMCEEWTKWIEAPTHHVTPTGRVKWPSISNVCEWVKNSWQRVKSETIVKSFKKCGISNALDGSEDDILYEESDASSENNREDDFNGSDDNFLGFYDD